MTHIGKLVAAAIVVISVLATTVMPAAAIPGPAPGYGTQEVAGWASWYEAGPHHDIDIWDYSWWRGWHISDGSNVSTIQNSHAQTWAIRSAPCGNHSYRHQGWNGAEAWDNFTFC